MKKGFFILFILLVCGVAIITCPTREAHKESIHSVFKSILNEELNKDNKGDNVFGTFIVSTVGNGVVELVIDQNLEIDNYFFFNVGRIGSNPKTAKKLSLGIFNHVFTISKEDIKKEIESNLDE